MYELLANHAAAEINHVKIDWEETMNRFPEFQVGLEDENQKALAMLSKILGKCDKVRHLGIGFKHPTEQILSSLGPIFKSLRSIQIPEVKINLALKFDINANYRKEIGSEVEQLDDSHINPDNDLNVIVRAERYVDFMNVLMDIYKMCEQWNWSPFVYGNLPDSLLYTNMPDQAKSQLELSELLNGTTKGLHLFNCWNVVCQQEIQCCPMLTHLALIGAPFKDILKGLSEALQNSKFPRLSHLSLANCSIGREGSLSSLFQSKCPTLEHLNLFRVEFKDFHFLHSVMTDSDNCVLPSLSSLVLDAEILTHRSSLSIMFQNPWTKMREIRCEGHRPPACFFSSIYHHKISEFISIINESKLPNLATLCLERVEGDLFMLDERKIPHLNALTLRLIKTSSLIPSLVEKLKTWKLEKLDISHNIEVSGNLHLLVGNVLPSLRSLIVISCRLNTDDFRSLVEANEKGRLPELKYLDISDNFVNVYVLLSAEFHSLQGLIVRKCGLDRDRLRILALANAAGKLPELRHLDISENGLGESLDILTRDPKTDLRSVKCDDVYWSNDDN